MHNVKCITRSKSSKPRARPFAHLQRQTSAMVRCHASLAQLTDSPVWNCAMMSSGTCARITNLLNDIKDCQGSIAMVSMVTVTLISMTICKHILWALDRKDQPETNISDAMLLFSSCCNFLCIKNYLCALAC